MPIDFEGQDLIVFDGTCLFCSAFARFILRHDSPHQASPHQDGPHQYTPHQDGPHQDAPHQDAGARFLFVTAQSDTGRALYHQHNLDPDLMETNIVILDGQAHVKMKAFSAAMSAIGWPWRALAIFGWIPQPISDWIYDGIARNRYRLGGQTCLVPSREMKARLVE